MLLLSEKLRLMRQLFGYSQEYIAMTIGMTQHTYCQCESGQAKPSLDKLQDLANMYQLTLGDLLKDNDTNFIANLLVDEHFTEKILGRVG